MMVNSLIDATLERIIRVYRPGILFRMKRFYSDEWRKLVALEEEINKWALKGNIERVRKVLLEYEGLVLDMMNMERPKVPRDGLEVGN